MLVGIYELSAVFLQQTRLGTRYLLGKYRSWRELMELDQSLWTVQRCAWELVPGPAVKNDFAEGVFICKWEISDSQAQMKDVKGMRSAC